MKTIAKMLAVAGMIFGVSAFADEGKDAGTVFFYQTAAGKQAVTGGLNYMSNSIKFSSFGGGTETVTATELHAIYEYGINDMFSAGAMIGDVLSGKTSLTGSTDTNYSGLENINLFFKGSYGMGSNGALKYGVMLSYSPGDQDIDGTTGAQTNAYTGGTTLTPYVGYQLGVGPGTLGAKISDQFNLGNAEIDQAGSKAKFTGNDVTEIDVFYEAHMWSGTFGGAISDMMYSKLSPSSGSSFQQTPTPYMGVKVYGDWNVGSGELLPTLSYAWSSDSSFDPNGSSGVSISSANILAVNVDYRWTF